MSHTFYIKNMVCDRCKTTVLNLLNAKGFHVETVQLGKIEVRDNSDNNYDEFEKELNALGFELITDAANALVEKIKIALIRQIDKGDTEAILSRLADQFGKNYSLLSKTFSRTAGMTLEKYLINLKIEKAKEYIQMKQLNFSEIAYSLNYKNSSHLAKQFKQITGMSMTAFKNLQNGNRKELDNIV